MVGRRGIEAAALCAIGFAACAPMSPAAIDRACAERARAAEGPQGAVGIGIGSGGGVSTGLAMSVSHDYLTGRDPEDVYQSCMTEGMARLEGA